MSGVVEAADRLSRSRVRILTVLMIFFAVQQANQPVTPPTRAVEWVGLGAWLVMALVLLLVLQTGGMWLRPRAARELSNDETTRAHRGEAMEWGFTGAIATAIAGSVIAALTEMPALVALRLVLLVGLFVATFRFVALEKRALG